MEKVVQVVRKGKSSQLPLRTWRLCVFAVKMAARKRRQYLVKYQEKQLLQG